MKGISDQDYKHPRQVWNTMKEKTLDCYHNTYLKTDVLLLADVFKTFWNTCFENYRLDPAHFYTAPGLAWQALLKTAALNAFSMKKGVKTVNYAPTSSGLSC